MKCSFCGDTTKDDTPILEWLEYHEPGFAPAHRKCSDACEDVASEVLSRWWAEAPSPVDMFAADRPDDSVPVRSA